MTVTCHGCSDAVDLDNAVIVANEFHCPDCAP